ncbi:MAG: hypothetical protein E7K72_25490, partial [Roseomonas mucosa]|nr:hypothetical protein [Roseomonas mucosa]
GDWSQLRDVVRASVAVDTLDDLHTTMDALRKGGLELAMKPKDRFAKPLPVGYRDVLMNVRFPNGVIGELQLHVKGMLQAKEEGHKPYETMRDIDAVPKAQRTDEQKAAYQKAFDDSVAIYGKAWDEIMAKSKGGKPPEGEEPMSKAMAMRQDDGGAAYDYFNHDGAIFRREGKIGGVDDVLHGNAWKPYSGNRTDPALYGDPISDPLSSGRAPAGRAGGRKVMAFRPRR